MYVDYRCMITPHDINNQDTNNHTCAIASLSVMTTPIYLKVITRQVLSDSFFLFPRFKDVEAWRSAVDRCQMILDADQRDVMD